MDNLFVYIPIFIVFFLVSSTFHEFAHAWAATKLGDDTPGLYGRLTLNPIPHIDPTGLIFLIVTLVISNGSWLFGWAKPVPFNPYKLRNPKAGIGLVAVAGPVSNILQMAVIALLIKIFQVQVDTVPGVARFFYLGLILNAWLAVFNLLPVPPLDGSKILFSLVPNKFVYVIERMERFSFIIIMILWFTGLIRYLVYPVGWLLWLMKVIFNFHFPADFL